MDGSDSDSVGRGSNWGCDDRGEENLSNDNDGGREVVLATGESVADASTASYFLLSN